MPFPRPSRRSITRNLDLGTPDKRYDDLVTERSFWSDYDQILRSRRSSTN